MIKRSAVVAFLLSGVFCVCMAQYGNSLYFSDREISPGDSNRLFLRLGNATFVNNKEFFNPYQPGYTLIGYYLRPVLEYYPGPDTRLRAGVHLLKYSGLERYSQAIPLFSLHHRFAPGLDMVMGSLYGALNHDLIEPLFAFDRVFTHHHESGLQFLIDRDFIKADIWLNWEQFIFHGDPFQEEFTAGLSSKMPLNVEAESFRIEIPVQLLVVHKGGQIDASGERLQTLVNFAGGLHLTRDFENGLFNSFGFRGYIAGFRDLSNELRYPYDRGWGLYPNVVIRAGQLEAGIGYWIGNGFVAPRGESVFQSVSAVDPGIAADRRDLLTSKIIFNRSLVRGIDMGLRFEVYYDRRGGHFDHSGGLHIIVDERFFIIKPERR